MAFFALRPRAKLCGKSPEVNKREAKLFCIGRCANEACIFFCVFCIGSYNKQLVLLCFACADIKNMFVCDLHRVQQKAVIFAVFCMGSNKKT